jgi:hypothetical protein
MKILDMEELKLELVVVLLILSLLKINNTWENLTGIISIESAREFKNSDKVMGKSTPYYS